MARRRLVGCLALLGGCLGLLWIVWSSGSRPLAREIRALSVRTRPPDASFVRLSEPRRSAPGWRADWELETEMAWDRYRIWLRDRLPEFEPTQTTEGSASFARWHGGDSWILTLSGTQAGARLRVSASLVVYPD